ncbi:MAG: hypothetical protein RBS73_16920 [Prolixibacteraceae bacterium]|jgi:MraZ protein|nr:hypothetical protein [Prolixibacteraceae bacterium]
MDFSGEKYATFDEKGRVVLPADFKNEMGGKIPGGQISIEVDPYEKCLNIYPMDVWEKRLSLFKSKLNRNNPQQSRLLDMIYKNFKVVSVSDNYRINFPNNFLAKVNITKDVVFVGVGDRIRLWDLAEYEKYNASMGDFSALFMEHFGNVEE